MINNVDIPCAVVDNDYIDDKYVPVRRISVLVVEEYDEKITDFILNKTTDGDQTKINDVDRLYDLIIMWNNPVNYYVDFTEQFEVLENYYIKFNKLSVDKNDLCYKYNDVQNTCLISK